LPAELAFSTDTRTLRRRHVRRAARRTLRRPRLRREALARGAAAVVVDDAAAVPDGVPRLSWRDTKAAYLAFAAAARGARARASSAITGSTGRRRPKALLAQVLERPPGGRVVATPANENNEIGVAKLLLGSSARRRLRRRRVRRAALRRDRAARAAALARRRVLTNIGDAHLEIMGSPNGSPRRSGEFSDRRACGSQCATSGFARARRRSRGARLVRRDRCGDAPTARRRWSRVQRGADAARHRATPSGASSFRPRATLPGRTQSRQPCGRGMRRCLALGQAPTRRRRRGLALPQGRYERSRIGDVDVIFDAYNASMSGTLATLDSFAREPAPAADRGARRAWRSSATDAAAMHERVGAAPRARISMRCSSAATSPPISNAARARRNSDPSASCATSEQRRSDRVACATRHAPATSCCSKARANTARGDPSKDCERLVSAPDATIEVRTVGRSAAHAALAQARALRMRLVAIPVRTRAGDARATISSHVVARGARDRASRRRRLPSRKPRSRSRKAVRSQRKRSARAGSRTRSRAAPERSRPSISRNRCSSSSTRGRVESRRRRGAHVPDALRGNAASSTACSARGDLGDRRLHGNAAALRADDRARAATIPIGRRDGDRARTGARAAIVDANDLGIAKVLGASAACRASVVERALRANPHGNGDEQTPIVVLAWRGAGTGPLDGAA
jgi:hypothetical protein